MVINSVDKNDDPGRPNQPGENNQMVLENMEQQEGETPNDVLIENMKEVDQQVSELFEKGRAFQRSLEDLWDIQGDDIPGK